nr:hypothetical protein [Tanacetum cinerariifolium]
VNTPISDEDRLELMELTVFLLPKIEKVRIGVNAVDLQVSAVRHKLLLFSLTNWCCSLSAVSSLKYALTVNPNIYVSCIKKFWTTVAVKQVNDVTRLQALVDKKKVVFTKAIIRDVLRLDDAEGVDCLPNEEIFAELSRMVYEKPSTKLTFYKVFFSSQWKFLIHTILQCMGAKRTSWNEFSSLMASAVICLSSGKGFSRVETPLFEGMLVEQEIDEEGDADEHVEEVNAGDPAYGDDSAAHREVPTVTTEPSIPSPTPPTPPPQPPQDIPSTSQVQQTQPQSPQVQPPSPQPQPLPQQAADFPMSLLKEAMDACVALTRRVEHLEYDKVAQGLEITKLKKRVKKLEKRNKGRMIAEMDQDDAVVLKDDKEEDKKVADAVKDIEEAKVDESAQDQGRQAESQAKIYKIDMDHANKVLSMQEDETKSAEVQEVVDVVTTAKLITEVVTAASETVTAASAIITAAEAQVLVATLTAAPTRIVAAPGRRRKGVVIRDPKFESTISAIIPAETKSKDKGKGILVEEPKPHKKKQQIKMDEQYARELHAEINKDIDWDEAINHVKRKNVAGFKMDYFKGMSYDDIRLIFEAKFNSNMDFLLKIKEQIEEDENIALKGQRMEATEIIWCADYNFYIYSADFVSGEEVPAHKIHSRPDVECQEIEEEGDEDEHVEDVTAGDDALGDDIAAHGERVDTSDDTMMDDESNQGRMIDEMDKDDAVVLMDEKEEDKKVEEAKVDESAQVQRRQAKSQAEIYKIDMDHANKVLSMQEDESEPDEVQEVVDIVTTAKLITEVVTAASETIIAASVIIPTAEPKVPAAIITDALARVATASSRRRKGVVIRDPEEESTTSEIISAETKFKDKGKGILVEEPKPLKKKQQIEMDEEYARKLHAELNKYIDCDVAIDHVKLKAKEDPSVKRYQAMKRKPHT